MPTVVSLESFQDRYLSGLLYSMLEGLNLGESLTLRAKDNFDVFLKELEEAKIENLFYDPPVNSDGIWQLVIWKKEGLKKVAGGSRLMCGGDK